MKVCTKCGQLKPLSAFYKDKSHSDGYKSWCKECYAKSDKERYEKNKEDYGILQRAQHIRNGMISHARKRGVKFDSEWFTTEKLFQIIKHRNYCECCGKRLKKTVNSDRVHPDSVTFDRFDSNKGYTPDNVRVICWRCNHIKNDATADEIGTVYDWMRSVEELTEE